MLNWLIKWLVSAISLLIVAYFVPGFHVNGFTAALIAAVVVGLINGTLGAVLKFFTWPLRLLTLGLLTWLINAAMLKLATSFVDGFRIDGWVPALIGSLLLAIVSTALRWIVPDFKKSDA
jgi:putative membrane protein